jgi:hypothetical protein
MLPTLITRAFSRREVTDLAAMLEGRILAKVPCLYLSNPRTLEPFAVFFITQSERLDLDRHLRDACFYLAQAARSLFPKEDFDSWQTSRHTNIVFNLLEVYDQNNRQK